MVRQVARRLGPALAVCVAAGWGASNMAGAATYSSFRPGQVWLDTDGNVIQAHDGGVTYHQGTYYWYGSEYDASGSGLFIGIRCYSSTDLYNWKYEGYALRADGSHSDLSPAYANSRAHVIYNAATAKFVMWLHVDDLTGFGRGGSRAGVARSSSPTGPFEYMGSFEPIQVPGYENGFRDDNVFLDDDGKAYAFYASESNWTMRVVRLSADFLDVERPVVENQTWSRILIGKNREAPAPFKYNGKYYLITSGCTGWSANPADWADATSPLGPYTQHGNPCVGANSNTTFNSQSTCVFPVAGRPPGSFIFMADRWNAGNLADSRYVWLPLKMNADGTFQLQWYDEWDLSVFGESAPVIALSPTSLAFGAMPGGPNPSAQNVAVTNSGAGTLADVTTSISYGSGSGWLTVTRSGSGNSQTLANSVNISGLAAR